MNKKLCIYVGLLLSLATCQSSFSMGKQLVLWGSKLLSGSAVIGAGLFAAHENRKEIDAVELEIDLFGEQIMLPGSALPENVDTFARKRLKECNVPNAQSIPIFCRMSGSWGTYSNKALFVGIEEADRLDIALRKRAEMDEKLDEIKKIFLRNNQLEMANFVENSIAQSDNIIALDAIVLGHEASHLLNDDTRKEKVYAKVAIPVGVQAVSSATSYGFNNIFGISSPKTWMKTLLRSGAAIGSVVPKMFLTGVAMVAYIRHQEATADEFACKNVQTLSQLEVFRDHWKKRENT